MLVWIYFHFLNWGDHWDLNWSRFHSVTVTPVHREHVTAQWPEIFRAWIQWNRCCSSPNRLSEEYHLCPKHISPVPYLLCKGRKQKGKVKLYSRAIETAVDLQVNLSFWLQCKKNTATKPQTTFHEVSQSTARGLCIVSTTSGVVIPKGCADDSPIGGHLKQSIFTRIHWVEDGEIVEAISTRGNCEGEIVWVISEMTTTDLCWQSCCNVPALLPDHKCSFVAFSLTHLPDWPAQGWRGADHQHWWCHSLSRWCGRQLCLKYKVRKKGFTNIPQHHQAQQMHE